MAQKYSKQYNIEIGMNTESLVRAAEKAQAEISKILGNIKIGPDDSLGKIFEDIKSSIKDIQNTASKMKVLDDSGYKAILEDLTRINQLQETIGNSNTLKTKIESVLGSLNKIQDIFKTINEFGVGGTGTGKGNFGFDISEEDRRVIQDIAESLKEIQQTIGKINSEAGEQSMLGNITKISTAVDGLSNKLDSLQESFTGISVSFNQTSSPMETMKLVYEEAFNTIRKEYLELLDLIQSKNPSDFTKSMADTAQKTGLVDRFGEGDLLFGGDSSAKGYQEKINDLVRATSVAREVAKSFGIDAEKSLSKIDDALDKVADTKDRITSGKSLSDEASNPFAGLMNADFSGMAEALNGIVAQLDQIIAKLTEVSDAFKLAFSTGDDTTGFAQAITKDVQSAKDAITSFGPDDFKQLEQSIERAVTTALDTSFQIDGNVAKTLENSVSNAIKTGIEEGVIRGFDTSQSKIAKWADMFKAVKAVGKGDLLNYTSDENSTRYTSKQLTQFRKGFLGYHQQLGYTYTEQDDSSPNGVKLRTDFEEVRKEANELLNNLAQYNKTIVDLTEQEKQYGNNLTREQQQELAAIRKQIDEAKIGRRETINKLDPYLWDDEIRSSYKATERNYRRSSSAAGSRSRAFNREVSKIERAENEANLTAEIEKTVADAKAAVEKEQELLRAIQTASLQNDTEKVASLKTELVKTQEEIDASRKTLSDLQSQKGLGAKISALFGFGENQMASIDEYRKKLSAITEEYETVSKNDYDKNIQNEANKILDERLAKQKELNALKLKEVESDKGLNKTEQSYALKLQAEINNLENQYKNGVGTQLTDDSLWEAHVAQIKQVNDELDTNIKKINERNAALEKSKQAVDAAKELARLQTQYDVESVTKGVNDDNVDYLSSLETSLNNQKEAYQKLISEIDSSDTETKAQIDKIFQDAKTETDRLIASFKETGNADIQKKVSEVLKNVNKDSTVVGDNARIAIQGIIDDFNKTSKTADDVANAMKRLNDVSADFSKGQDNYKTNTAQLKEYKGYVDEIVKAQEQIAKSHGPNAKDKDLIDAEENIANIEILKDKIEQLINTLRSSNDAVNQGFATQLESYYKQQLSDSQKVVDAIELENSARKQANQEAQEEKETVESLRAAYKEYYSALTEIQKLQTNNGNKNQLNTLKQIASNALDRINTLEGSDPYSRLTDDAKRSLEDLEKKYVDGLNKAQSKSQDFFDKLGTQISNTANTAEEAQSIINNKLKGFASHKIVSDWDGSKLIADVETVTGKTQRMTYTWNEFTHSLYENVKVTGTVGATLNKFLSDAAKSIGELAGRYITFQTFTNAIKTGITYVRELNTALAEFKMVTGSSDAFLKEFAADAANIAYQVGSTTSTITNSATEWGRLGYSASESLELAESAAKLATAGFMSADEATTHLTSSLSAFYTGDLARGIITTGEAADELTDKMIRVGNTLPISASGIGEGLERAAGTLFQASNTIDESIALLASANATIQNPQRVGTAMQTVAMRLRGTKASEISKAVEGVDLEGMSEDASKLYDTVKKLTSVKSNNFSGVSILTDTGAYKSTYEILKEISEVWNEMNDTSQAALVEEIAGKRQAAIVSAMMNNSQLMDKALQESQNAAGATEEAMEVAMDSIDKRIAQLQQSWQQLWQDFIDSDTIKNAVSLLTQLVRVLDKVVNASSKLSKNAALFGTIGGGASLLNSLTRGQRGASLFNIGQNGASLMGVPIQNMINDIARSSFSKNGINDSVISAIVEDIDNVDLSKADSIRDSLLRMKVASDESADAIANNLSNAFIKSGKSQSDFLSNTIDIIASTTKMGSAMSGFGTIATSVFKGLASAVVSAGISIAITAIISLIAKAVEYLVTYKQKAIEAADSITAGFKEIDAQHKENSDSLKGLKQEYDTLSQGVDKFGNNVSLTADEYDRYNEIVDEIISKYPTLETGYNTETGYLQEKVDLLQQAIDLEEEEYHKRMRDQASGQNATVYTRGKLLENEKQFEQREVGTDNLRNVAYNLFRASGLYGSKDIREELAKAYGINDDGSETFVEFFDRYADDFAKGSDKFIAVLNQSISDQVRTSDDFKDASEGWVVQCEQYLDEYGSITDQFNQEMTDFIKQYVENNEQFLALPNNTQKLLSNIIGIADSDIINPGDDEKVRKKLDNLVRFFSVYQDKIADIASTNKNVSPEKYYQSIEKQLKELYSNLPDYGKELLQRSGIENAIDLGVALNVYPVTGKDRHAVKSPKDLMDSLSEYISDTSTLSSMSQEELEEVLNLAIQWREENPDAPKTTVAYLKSMIEVKRRLQEQDQKSFKSLADLTTAAAEYSSAVESTNNILLDRTEISADEYEQIKKTVGANEDLASILEEVHDADGEVTGYIVKNAKALRDLTNSSITATDAYKNLHKAQEQASIQYSDATRKLAELVTSKDKFSDATMDDISALKQEISSLQNLIDQYADLEQQLLGSTNAYTRFSEAQARDNANNYNTQFTTMLDALNNSLETRQFGLESVQVAVEELIGSDFEAEEAIDKRIHDWLEVRAKKGIYTFDENGAAKITAENIEKIVKLAEQNVGDTDALFKVNNGQWNDFELNGKKAIEDVADFFSKAFSTPVSIEEAYMLLKEIDKYKTNGSSTIDNLIVGDPNSTINQLKTITDETARLSDELSSLYQKNELGEYIIKPEDQARAKELTAAIIEQQTAYDNLRANAIPTVEAIIQKQTELNEKNDELDNLMNRISNETVGTKAYDDLADQISTVLGETEALQEEIDDLGGQDIEIEVKLALEEYEKQKKALEEQLAVVKSDPNAKAGDVAAIQKQINEIEAKEAEIRVNFKPESETVKEDLETVQNYTIDDKRFKVVVTGYQSTLNQLTELANAARRLEGVTSIKTSVSSTRPVVKPGLTGQTKAHGGIANSGRALVGELGQELVVSDGKFYTVGDNGAEFVNLKKGDIVFNHKQTQQLLSSGHTSRGRALADGNAFDGGSNALITSLNTNGSISTKGYGKITADVAKAVEKASKAASDSAKKAADESSKEWIDAFNEVAENIKKAFEESFLDITNNSSIMASSISDNVLEAYANIKNDLDSLDDLGINLGDTTALNIDAQKISEILANIGDEAEAADIAMQYLGSEGSLSRNLDTISRAAEDAGYSLEDYLEVLKDVNDAERRSSRSQYDLSARAAYYNQLTALYEQYYDNYGRASEENAQKLHDAWVKLYENEKSTLDTAYSNMEMTTRSYLMNMQMAYKSFYDKLPGYARESAEAQKTYIRSVKDAYERMFSAASRLISNQISNLQDAMNAQIKALEAAKKAAVAPIEAAIKAIDNQIYEYQQMIYGLQDQIWAIDQQIKALEKEKKPYEKRIKEYEKQIKANEKLIKQNDKLIKAKEKEIKANDKIIESYEEQIDANDKIIKEKEREIKANEKIIKSYEKEQNVFQDQIDANNDLVKAMEDANSERQRSIDLQKAEYELARAQNQKTQQVYTAEGGFQYQTDQSAIRDAQNNLDDQRFEAQKAEFEKLNQALQQQVDLIQEQIDKLDEQNESVQEEIDLIEEQNERIQDQIDLIEERNKGIEKQIEVLNERNEEIQEQNELIQEQIEIEQEQIDLIQEKIDALNEEKEAIQDIIDRYQHQIELLNRQKEALERQKQAIEEYYDAMIEATREFYEEQIDALEKILKELEKLTSMKDLAESMELLETFGVSLDDLVNNTDESMNNLKETYARILAGMYKDTPQILDIWEKLLGVDMSQFSGEADDVAKAIDQMLEASLGIKSDLTPGLDSAKESFTNLGETAKTSEEGLSKFKDTTTDTVTSVKELDQAGSSGGIKTLTESFQKLSDADSAKVKEISEAIVQIADAKTDVFDALGDAVDKINSLNSEAIDKLIELLKNLDIDCDECVIDFLDKLLELSDLSSEAISEVETSLTAINDIAAQDTIQDLIDKLVQLSEMNGETYTTIATAMTTLSNVDIKQSVNDFLDKLLALKDFNTAILDEIAEGIATIGESSEEAQSVVDIANALELICSLDPAIIESFGPAFESLTGSVIELSPELQKIADALDRMSKTDFTDLINWIVSLGEQITLMQQIAEEFNKVADALNAIGENATRIFGDGEEGIMKLFDEFCTAFEERTSEFEEFVKGIFGGEVSGGGKKGEGKGEGGGSSGGSGGDKGESGEGEGDNEWFQGFIDDINELAEVTEQTMNGGGEYAPDGLFALWDQLYQTILEKVGEQEASGTGNIMGILNDANKKFTELCNDTLQKTQDFLKKTETLLEDFNKMVQEKLLDQADTSVLGKLKKFYDGGEFSWVTLWNKIVSKVNEAKGKINSAIEEVLAKLNVLIAKIQEAIAKIDELIEKFNEIPAGLPGLWTGSAFTPPGMFTGTAFVNGNWGLKKKIKDPQKGVMVGELGPELVVRGDRYFTVGDNGAEIRKDLHPDDIIFNHAQTRAIFKYGKIGSRGKAYAQGNTSDLPAFMPSKMPDWFDKLSDHINNIDLNIAKMIPTAATPRLAYANAAGNVMNNSSGDTLTIQNLNVTMPNFNSSNSDGFIRDLKSKAVQRFSRRR